MDCGRVAPRSLAAWTVGHGGGGRGVNVPMRTYFLSACKIVLRVFRSIDS